MSSKSPKKCPQKKLLKDSFVDSCVDPNNVQIVRNICTSCGLTGKIPPDQRVVLTLNVGFEARQMAPHRARGEDPGGGGRGSPSTGP